MATLGALVFEPAAHGTGLRVHHDEVLVETRECLDFIDVTERVLEVVRRAGIRDGLVNVQTRHTTTAVLVNEHEPLLLEDMKQTLERLAGRTSAYRHDDFAVRTVNMCPDEEKNGHSHCKAMFLRASETLNLAGGRMQLGQWQRIFLIELDRGKRRTLSVTVMGAEGPPAD